MAKNERIRSDSFPEPFGQSDQGLTGVVPFPDLSPIEVIVKHVKGAKPRPISEFRSDLSSWIDSAVEWMMQVDPERRPESAREVIDFMESGSAEEEG